MRLRITKYGWPQVFVLPLIHIAAMVVALLVWPKSWSLWAVVLVEAILAVSLVWTLSFFRDPHRAVPPDTNLLLAPADGRITDIEMVHEDGFIGGAALRIGIFLSIFDVHINRAPCNVRVERISYERGVYTNAMNPRSGRVNESNELALIRTEQPQDKLIVRQVSGAIARRIVCAAQEGENLSGGQKFGMIKFGSRTELYVPAKKDPGSSEWLLGAGADATCLVQVGQKVKAGVSALVRYQQCPD
jgi:phosphatidylserine decarboxylase